MCDCSFLDDEIRKDELVGLGKVCVWKCGEEGHIRAIYTSDKCAKEKGCLPISKGERNEDKDEMFGI